MQPSLSVPAHLDLLSEDLAHLLGVARASVHPLEAARHDLSSAEDLRELACGLLHGVVGLEVDLG